MQKHHRLGSGTTDTVFTGFIKTMKMVDPHCWKDTIFNLYPLQSEWFLHEHISLILGMWNGEMVSLSSAFAVLSSGTFPFSISTFPSITWVSTPLAAWNNFWRFQETDTRVKEQTSSLVLVRLAWKQPGGGKQTFQPHFKGNPWSVVGKSRHFKHFNSSNTPAVPLWWWADWPSAGGFWDQSGWWPWRAGRLPETWTWRGWRSWSRPPSPRIRGCRP